MDNFLHSTIGTVLEGYCYNGATSPKKVYPIHSYGNNKILNNLGSGYEGHGFGIGDEKEYTINTALGNWKSDGYFFKPENNKRLIRFEGMAIDYKCPMSNIQQNKNNILNTIKGEAATIRPFGYGFAVFLVLPDESLWFKKGGLVKNHENTVTETILKEISKISQLSPSKYQGVPDLIGICSYKLPIDYSKIKTKEEFEEAIKNCDRSQIEYVNYNTIISSDRLIYNNPDAFFKTFSEMTAEKKPFYVI